MDTKQRSVIRYEPQRTMSLEQCIWAWMDAKAKRSESNKTKKAYQDALLDFRTTLQSQHLDLDSEPALIAPLAQGWAGQSTERENVAPSTFNQRLAILSSFYRYAKRHDVLSHNPIERVERRVVQNKNAASHLSKERVQEGLMKIDRSTLEGKRDYALLSVALATGRRSSELAGLRYGHLQRNGETCTVIWVRCKGNKQMKDELQKRTTLALFDYLIAQYGTNLLRLKSDTPVWVSYSSHNEGQAIGSRTVSRICEKYMGTSKVHALRHTWAVTMHNKGASLAEIGKGLGHSNLKTTADYLEQHLGYINPHASDLEQEYGI